MCLHGHEVEESDRALARATALDAQYAPALGQRALLHLYYGRLADAEAAARGCLALEPGNVTAWAVLSRVRRGALDPADRAVLESIAGNATLDHDHRIPAAFALAHAADADPELEPAQAFAAYARAHELALERDRREKRHHDRRAFSERCRALAQLVTIAPEPAEPPADQPRPIFIVGMPRSGTTLVEALLGAHPRVAAGGELPLFRQVFAIDSNWRELTRRLPVAGLIKDDAALIERIVSQR